MHYFAVCANRLELGPLCTDGSFGALSLSSTISVSKKKCHGEIEWGKERKERPKHCSAICEVSPCGEKTHVVPQLSVVSRQPYCVNDLWVPLVL